MSSSALTGGEWTDDRDATPAPARSSSRSSDKVTPTDRNGNARLSNWTDNRDLAAFAQDEDEDPDGPRIPVVDRIPPGPRHRETSPLADRFQPPERTPPREA